MRKSVYVAFYFHEISRDSIPVHASYSREAMLKLFNHVEEYAPVSKLFAKEQEIDFLEQEIRQLNQYIFNLQIEIDDLKKNKEV